MRKTLQYEKLGRSKQNGVYRIKYNIKFNLSKVHFSRSEFLKIEHSITQTEYLIAHPVTI